MTAATASARAARPLDTKANARGREGMASASFVDLRSLPRRAHTVDVDHDDRTAL